MDTTTLKHALPAPHTVVHGPAREYTDEALMLAIYDDKAEWALEELYTRYKRYVYSLAYGVLRDGFLAEDVIQDVFLTIWHKAFSYQEAQGSVRGWLQAIVHNRAIDKVRSLALRECVQLEAVNGEMFASSEPESWERVWESEQATFIRKALAQLPPEQRQAIELSYFRGYTHIQIAELQHIPLGTAKGRMRLGLQKLKLLLQEYGVDLSR